MSKNFLISIYHKAKRNFILILLWVILFPVVNLNGQELFNNDKRAEYIFTIAKNIKWPESKMQKSIFFGLTYLGSDTALQHALMKRAGQLNSMYNKPIKVFINNSFQSERDVHILFINKKENYDIEKVYQQIKGKGILLVSEGYSFNESMINFIEIDGKREFEINEKRIAEEGFIVNKLFLALAIKTKQDWEALYIETEVLLDKEKETVKVQKEVISEQSGKIFQLDSVLDTKAKLIDLQQNKLQSLFYSVAEKQKELADKEAFINERKEQIITQKKELLQQGNSINTQRSILKKQIAKIKTQEGVLLVQLEKIRTQNVLLSLAIVALLMVLITIYFVARAYIIKKKSNAALHSKNIEIQAQRDEIVLQKKEITDSIIYARRIQTAILPPEAIIKNVLSDHFILYKPRDIVSGDFYLMTQVESILVITAVDCTGHGVPGALMSMLGIAYLNEIVKEKGITNSSDILNRLRKMLLQSLNQAGTKEETKDGMDMALCVINTQTLECTFSGAYNPLYHISNNNLTEFKADKMPVGLSEKINESFTESNFKINKGDTLYLFSDGYPDQFGGENNKKFMAKRFKELLLQIQTHDMTQQHNILDTSIKEWMKNYEQVDDILVVGIKI
ncbi:MAG: DUF4154 domain-containing protein [Bacteroidales bacterium]|nr:DUF4154 domain-containing protein [Bacteroidales bacterium]